MEIAKTKNLQKATSAINNLRSSDCTVPKIALLCGPTGTGKTTVAGRLFVKEKGLLLEPMPGATQKTLLQKLLNEMSLEASGTNAAMVDQVIQAMLERPRIIFIDEADRLLGDQRMLESLRAIHDRTAVPIVLIGMTSHTGHKGIDQRIKRFPQFADRISEWVVFEWADLADAKSMAELYCPDLKLEEGLVKHLLTESKGNFRRIRVGLAGIQKVARDNGIKTLGLGDWADRKFFYSQS